MPIFLSYSRQNEDVIKGLARGLEAARRVVWYDLELSGGEIWWTKILANIRDCTVFIFGLSDHALRSKACMAEFNYAVALGKPILPVQVDKIEMELANPLSSVQMVAYRSDEAEAGFQVLAAVDALERNAGPMPEVLPPEPQIPFAYLRALARQIDTEELRHSEQEEVVEHLRKALRDEYEPGIRNQVLGMLRNLLNKPWITRRTERDIRGLLLVESRDNTQPSVVLPRPGPEVSGKAADPPEPVEPVKPAEPVKKAEEPEKPVEKPQERESQHPPVPGGQTIFEKRMAEVQARLEAERRKADAEQLGDWASHKTPDGSGAGGATPARHAPIWTGIRQPSEPAQQEPPMRTPARPEPIPGPTVFQPQPYQPQPYQPQPYQPQPILPPQQTPYTMTVSYGVTGSARVSPPNYWALSIVAFLCSFLFGGIAMYFSYQVGQRFNANDDNGAAQASRNAKVWGIVGIAVGIVVWFAIAAGNS